jgi:pimeloyl-ACP methyl ester carboxylesterase
VTVHVAGGTVPAVTRPTPPVGAAALLVLALVAGACSSDDSTASPTSTTPDTLGATTTTAGAAHDGDGDTTYVVPPQHPSDWGAPDVALPDAPRPYGPSPEPTADPAFYDVTTLDPDAVGAAEPGDVLRSEAVELTGPLAGVSGWRILYRSTTTEDAPAVVSGMVLVPEGDAPDGGRPVVAWAHGTTGIADRCAPSATGNLLYDDYGAVGRNLVDQGFVVTATDYHGLGTPGVHTYHHSDELARATIDSVAAAHDLAEAAPLSEQWATVGHSEGGLASLATDARTADALADLDYRGSVVAAPTPPLGTYAPLMFGIEGRGYAVLLLEAVAGVAPDLAPAVALGPEAATRTALLTHGCWEEAVPGFDDIAPDDMLADPEIGQRLAEVMADWAAYDPTEARGPLLVVQGEADAEVLPPLTALLIDELCPTGAAIEYRTYPGAGHDEVMAAAADDLAAWLTARFAGEAPPVNCDET